MGVALFNFLISAVMKKIPNTSQKLNRMSEDEIDTNVKRDIFELSLNF
jgi:hypothetical protein